MQATLRSSTRSSGRSVISTRSLTCCAGPRASPPRLAADRLWPQGRRSRPWSRRLRSERRASYCLTYKNAKASDDFRASLISTVQYTWTLSFGIRTRTVSSFRPLLSRYAIEPSRRFSCGNDGKLPRLLAPRPHSTTMLRACCQRTVCGTTNCWLKSVPTCGLIRRGES